MKTMNSNMLGKIKRTAAVLLTAAISLSLLAGCGKDKQPQQDAGQTGEIPLATQKAADSDGGRVQDNKEQSSKAQNNPTQPEPAALRDVKGMSLDNVKAVLENAGFKVTVNEEYSDTVEKNSVISQSPSVDNNLKLKKGDTVTLTVSKGRKPQTAQYLDTIVYSGFTSESKNTKMSAYSGKDYFGNECRRAIKFECDGNKNNYKDPNGTQTVKVIYAVGNGISKFSATLTPVMFLYDINYIHVNLYKDDTLLYSMDVSEDTKPLELSYDLSGASTFSIELTYEAGPLYAASEASIAFADAKFE